MKATDKLFDTYRPLGRRGNRELLLAHRDVVRFIDDCEVAGLVILGIDFFREVGADVVPTLDSADFSSIFRSQDAVTRSAEAARQLIQDSLPDGAAWAEFVVTELEPG